MIEKITNGTRLQTIISLVITLSVFIFSIGVLWHKISANAEKARETIQQIRDEQLELKAKVELLLEKKS